MTGFQCSTLSYVLHGLRVSSSAPIPGLQSAEFKGPSDLHIWLGQSPLPTDTHRSASPPASDARVWFESSYTSPTGEPILTAERVHGGRYYRITYCDGVTFVLDRDVTTIWVTWPSDETRAYVPSYLLGPIIGVVLRLRGITCLHASGIVVDDQAVIFAGREGSGKSTTAAAFGMRGFRVLADDTVALRREGGVWLAAPGYPRLRLWPESAHAVAGEGRASALVPPGESGTGNRYHLDLVSAGCFQARPVAVCRVYVLHAADDDTMSITPFSPADAVAELVGNTFATRTLDRSMRADEFAVLSELVDSVPVRLLTRPASFAKLSEFCDNVLNDLRECSMAMAR